MMLIGNVVVRVGRTHRVIVTPVLISLCNDICFVKYQTEAFSLIITPFPTADQC